PRHWVEKPHEPTYEARIWALGQVASAETALKLLADRAGSAKAPWPEFAEYDCYACHHDLREPSWRQQRGYEQRLPGSLTWNEWYTVRRRYVPAGQPPAALDDLRKEMNKPVPNRSEVAQKAREAAAQLAGWRSKLAGVNIGRDAVRKEISLLG